MSRDELKVLIQKYADGTSSVQEKKQLEDLVLRKPMLTAWDWESHEQQVLMGISIKQKIDAELFAKPRKVIRWKLIASVAAAVIVLCLLFKEFYNPISSPVSKQAPLLISEQVAMQDTCVMLHLADGRRVALDDSTELMGQNNWKFQDGRLVYSQLEAPAQQQSLAFNKVEVPHGKQVQLLLPDGTRVWLNTASWIEYPVAFDQKQRQVRLHGEAYFEVAHNPKVPFVIDALGTQVKVTGTAFNISAYPSDGSVTTTLLKGGVEIQKGQQQIALKPGQKAVAGDDGISVKQGQINTEQTLAWKNGYFMFEEMDIVSVMRSVARWYGIEVRFDGKLPDIKIGGTFPVTADLEEFLADLHAVSKITFKRKGKEVWVVW